MLDSSSWKSMAADVAAKQSWLRGARNASAPLPLAEAQAMSATPAPADQTIPNTLAPQTSEYIRQHSRFTACFRKNGMASDSVAVQRRESYGCWARLFEWHPSEARCC